MIFESALAAVAITPETAQRTVPVMSKREIDLVL
jgi:hypothetical protein